MAFVANPELITPNLSFHTGIRLQADDGSTPDNAETIHASVCSEFKIHSIPAVAFDATHKLRIALDSAHQPVVFTIGNDQRFYCIQHMTGESWTATDITPDSDTATAITFDVFQHSSGKVAIGVAVNTAASSSVPTIYYASPFNPTGGFNASSISFRKINNDPSVPIVSMTIAASDTDLNSPCFIVIGTQDTPSTRATDYVVSADPSNRSPWKIISIPENATKVFQVVPVTQRKPFNACVASLYQQVVSGHPPPADVGTAISCLSLGKSLNIAVVLDKIGGGRDVAAIVTSKGLSDLYVAGVKGLGYYSSQKMNQDPVVILPEVSFQQVVASENSCKICIFALATVGDLYYIEGTRMSPAAIPEFTWPSYPIRKEVGILATQYNAAVNASETMYVDSADQLKHIWRDAETETWSEQTIHVPTTGEAVSYPAFVSQIHLEGSGGATIGDGREIMLSATELAYVVINDKTHRLDREPVTLTTDETGYIRIVMQAGPQLASPTITATIKGVVDADYSFRVEPRQRVIRKWAHVQAGSDLKNAKSTDGKPVFSDTKIDDKTFDAAAGLLKQIPELIDCVDESASTLVGADIVTHSVRVPTLFFACHKTPSGHQMSLLEDWMVAFEDASDAVGDFLESVWNGIRQVAKFAIKIVGDVINFFAEIQGKVLRWVLDTVGSVIRCIATFLKETLDIDISRFLALFGFLWDYPSILETQQIIVKTVHDGSLVLQDIVQRNADWMKKYIKGLRSLVTPFIKDERVSKANNFRADAGGALGESFLGKLLKSVLNNPIVGEVLRYASMWILKVISVLEDEISFPSLGDLEKLLDAKFTALLKKLMNDAEDDLFNLVKDIFNGIGEVIAGKRNIGDLFTKIFSGAFWSVFDAAEDIALALVDLLSDLVAGIVKLITDRIKLPGISAFWESFTKTTFSIVDIASLALAQVMYLVTMMWQEKLPFEVMTPWFELLPEKGSVRFPPVGDMAIPMELRSPAAAAQFAADDALTHLMVDLCCGWVSSIASMANSACALAILSPSGRMEGFELNNYDGEGISSSFPTIAAKRTALPVLRNLQLACSGIGFITKLISLINGFTRKPSTPRGVCVSLFKSTAVLMNGIVLIVRIKSWEGKAPWALYLAPAGNIIGTLPGGIWGFVDSKQETGDWILFLNSISSTTAAGCDICTTVLSQRGQVKLKWIPFGISAGLNLCQVGTTAWYYVECTKNKAVE